MCRMGGWVQSRNSHIPGSRSAAPPSRRQVTAWYQSSSSTQERSGERGIGRRCAGLTTARGGEMGTHVGQQLERGASAKMSTGP